MAKHSVDVLVKARDQASKKFNKIGHSALGMGSAIKKAAAAAAVYFGARAIKNFAASSLQAFGYQEEALFTLASQLALLGKYSQETLTDYKKFAAGIQEVTTFGDEQVLSLMRMGLTFGATTDQLKEATKASLALSAMGGRLKPEMGMRYYLQALNGVTSSLETYVPSMRKAITYEGKMVELHEAVARGWNVQTAKAKTYLGTLTQMKNTIGDYLNEKIGAAMAPYFKAMFKQIKQWVMANGQAIANWVGKVMNYIALAKDVFMDFVKFMQTDWRSGMQFAFDSFITLLSATMDTAVLMAIAGGKGIWKGVKEVISGGKEGRITSRADEIYEKKYSGKDPWHVPWEEGIGGNYNALENKTANDPKLYAEAMAKATAEENKKTVEKIFGDTKQQLQGIWKDAWTDIKTKTPPALAATVEESFNKFLGRAAAIGKVKPWQFEQGEGAGDGGGGGKSGAASQVAGKFSAVTGRFLTMAPGAKVDWDKQTASNTKQQIANQKEGLRLQKRSLDRLNKMNGYLASNAGGYGVTAFS